VRCALVFVVMLTATAVVGCGGHRTAAPAHTTTSRGQATAPHYRSCGARARAKIGRGLTALPTYAHGVSCAIATAVAKTCAARSCFGQFGLGLSNVGWLYFPEAPRYKPFGFECYQAVPPYDAGLPGPVAPAGGEWRPVVCHREPGANSQQLVGYFVLVGSGP
jgi:hypothetical protein